MTSKHEKQNEAVLDQFTKQANAYAELTKGSQDKTLAPLLDATHPTSDDMVLDVGCGPGSLTLPLAQICGHVIGFDLTEAMIDQAKARQAEMGIDNVDWQIGDALPLPFEDHSFSLIVTRATFHHMAEPTKVLAEMERVCKPGGRIVVIDLTPDEAKAGAFNEIEKLRDPSHVQAFPPIVLRTFGRKEGLTELAFETLSQTLPLEAVLATSFPKEGDMERVRKKFRNDAKSGADQYGMKAYFEGDDIMISYPMTLLAWKRA